MMGKYILWGKDPESGLNGKQLGIQLETKHGTWDEDRIDSLDALMESPTFSEASLNPLGTTQYRVKKEVFSREEALANSTGIVRESFVHLFDEIDKLELSIALYELAHNKRTKEIRSSLLNKFSEEELRTLREKVSHWNQYRYLNKRHELVEMRREQYTLRDSYRAVILTPPNDRYNPEENYDFDAGIEVLPLGLKQEEGIAAQVFRTWRELVPGIFSQNDEKLVSDLYWAKQDFHKKIQSAPSASHLYFDFRDVDHVFNLLDQQIALEEFLPERDVMSNLSALIDTLQFYVAQADLTDIQREILDMKLRKCKNVDIAESINKKYGKTYTPNYISTIFRQRIIPRINDAAIYHEKIIGNIFFPEEFKTCTGCGETMLRDPDNFTRKSRSNDGFSSRCKKCEKKARQGG